MVNNNIDYNVKYNRNALKNRLEKPTYLLFFRPENSIDGL